MAGFIKDSNGIWRFQGVLIGDAAVALEENAAALSAYIASPVVPTLTSLSTPGTTIGALGFYGGSLRVWNGTIWSRVGEPYTGTAF